MYAILGKITNKFENNFIIISNNIYYQIFTSNVDKVEIDKEVKIYTRIFIREDEIFIVGFVTMLELELFKSLITINGIGPKIALSAMRTISPESFINAIANKDSETISKLNGINENIAILIVNKLAKKFIKYNLLTDGVENVDINEEVVRILLSLGYKMSDINAIKYKLPKSSTLKESLSYALKELNHVRTS
jgi:Holliday junction DNA helicase RuvA